LFGHFVNKFLKFGSVIFFVSEESSPVIENLSFRYRSRDELALKNVNISVGSSQVILIAGASGCGKTTLAR
jgi:ABC-type bacteriocin/lantibiotic exporter with double-glycine peptidase domain